MSDVAVKFGDGPPSMLGMPPNTVRRSVTSAVACALSANWTPAKPIRSAKSMFVYA